jgi:hypothetical protein
VAKFHDPAALPPGKEPRRLLSSRLGGPQNESGFLREENDLLPLPGFEHVTFYHLNTRRRDSSVGIVTGLWARRSGVRGVYSSVLQNGLRGSFAPWVKGT